MPGGRRGAGGQQRIVGQHLHLQPHAALGHLAADVAEADHAQRLAGDLHAHELLLLPLALLHAGGGLGDLARQGEHVGRWPARRRRWRCPSGVLMTWTFFSVAALTSMLSTPTPARPTIFRLRGLGQDVGGDLGGRADRQPVVAADDLGQLGGGSPVFTSTDKPGLAS